MTIIAKPKPAYVRALKRARTDWRKWASDKPLEVQHRVREIVCPNLRLLAREPLNDALRAMAIDNVLGVIQAHGEYRNY